MLIRHLRKKLNAENLNLMENNILFRASQTGKLMTNARSGNGLSETTKTYLNEVFIEQFFGIKKDIHSKYIAKGLQVEESSLDLFAKVSDEVYFKNEQLFKNDFIMGTPDIITDDMVIDLKSSWSLFTFFEAKNSPLNKMYYWQLQSYMALTGKDKAQLVYCLIDTPFQLIEDEKRKLMWKMGLIDESPECEEAFDEIEKSHSFSHIPDENRTFTISIDRNNSDIELLYDKVKICRKYINNLK